MEETDMDLPFRWIVFLIVLCFAHAASCVVADTYYPGCTSDGRPSSLRVGDPIPMPT